MSRLTERFSNGQAAVAGCGSNCKYDFKYCEEEGFYGNVFPMVVECKRVVDRFGFAYGDAKDFCGSKIEIELEDIKKHSWYKYPDYSGIDYGFKCPVCGKFVVIDKNKIPKKVLDEAQEISVGR